MNILIILSKLFQPHRITFAFEFDILVKSLELCHSVYSENRAVNIHTDISWDLYLNLALLGSSVTAPFILNPVNYCV